MPLVSVVLPTYNGAKYIGQALDNCLRQSISDIEVIVVDGGSLDGTPEIVAAYADPRIHLIHQPANAGKLPGALNLGFKYAKGEYLTWTHDDNWYEVEAIEIMERYLEKNPGVDFVYSDYWKVDENGNIISRFYALPPEYLTHGNCVGHSFLYRRKVYEIVGDYDPEFFMAEDYEYWLRVNRCCRMVPLSRPLYYYRIHPNSLTERTGGIEAQQRAAERARLKWIGPDPYKFPSRYARSISEVYLHRAFEAHRAGHWQNRRLYLLQALRYDLRHLKNRGVRSLLVRSLLRFLTGRE